MAFDLKCLELAQYFLPADPALARLTDGLAQHIQDSVENWLAAEQAQLTASLTPPSDGEAS